MNMSHLPPIERGVAKLIIMMFMDKYPSEKLGFNPKDIYQVYNHLLEGILPNYHHKKRAVIKKIRSLCQRGELIQPKGKYTEYFLVPNGCLHIELQRRIDSLNANRQK